MKRLFLLTTLLFAGFLMAAAQVTIGIEEAPVSGSLLQLKDKNVTDGKANATKGLLLPRVELDAVNSVSGTIAQKLLNTLKLTLPSGITFNAEQHTGLMVYNINTQTVASGAPFSENKVCPGVYVWNGSSWNRLMAKECE